jgi:hypothetical protein
MGKTILIIFAVLIISFASAEIIINEQPKEVYNFGDTLPIDMTVKTTTDVSGYFYVNLFCKDNTKEVGKIPLTLSSGEEDKIKFSLGITKDMIGELKGDCKIKGIFKEEYVLTNDFKISDLINIEMVLEKTEFNPGEKILIEGKAVKENKENANGFIELEIIYDNASSISQLSTINNGFFSVNLSFPEDMKAGACLVKLNAYEKNLEGEITNNGFKNYNIRINQIPTNLEIVFENSEVEPGTNLKVKTILHDQTGEKIESVAIITIKNENNEIFGQTEKPTDEFLEFPVAYNEPPAEWTVVAVSNKMASEAIFKIKVKKSIVVEVINKTLILTNTGNVLYSDDILIKIGNNSLNLNVNLGVDESQKYILSAPNGKYQVEIITGEETKILEGVPLTGKAIDVKKAPDRVLTLVKYPAVWIFIIAILGFVAFIVFKKGYQKSFFGYIRSKKKEKGDLMPLKKSQIINAKNKAELSLSIKGEKQNASVVCLKIKNFKEITSHKSNAEETLQRIVDTAEESKAATYENQDNLFFILAPVKTRTFKNEKTAVNIAQKIKDSLAEHNKLSKQKIEFGISLNYGTIIAKQEKDILKFMSMGTLITTAKKISSLSEGEIFLSEGIKEKLMSGVKTEKHTKEKISFYTIKEIKNREENKNFIKNFLERIEGKE